MVLVEFVEAWIEVLRFRDVGTQRAYDRKRVHDPQQAHAERKSLMAEASVMMDGSWLEDRANMFYVQGRIRNEGVVRDRRRSRCCSWVDLCRRSLRLPSSWPDCADSETSW